MNDQSTLSTDSSPEINPDVQEALSLRYTTAAIIVPLKSGKWGVFANDRTPSSLIICEPDNLHLVAASRAKLNPQKTQAPPSIDPEKLAALDFSDL